MKSLTTAQSMLFLLVAAACGGNTVDLGGPPDGGTGGRTSGSAGSTGTSMSTTTSTTTSGPGTSAGGGTGTTTNGTAGDRPGTTGVGGNPNTGGAGGRGGAGMGGAVSDAGPLGCGARSMSSCPAGTFCDYAPSAMCGAGDQGGTCQPKPQACTADCPGVCGCDGKFYCNACTAHSLGVDDNPSNTSCRPLPPDAGQVCGGLAGLQCPATSYCKFGPMEQCGVADGQGVCQPRPGVCPADCGMVCGCDGKMYCNACVAAAAGVDVSPNPATCRP